MKVILPGSYDPVTAGHLEIIKRAALEYDEVYVVIFTNPNKKYTFSLDDRVRMLILATDEFDNVMVSYSGGLVIDYMRDHGIDKIIKGYRTDADLSWEYEQAEWNKLHGGYDTELWKCDGEFTQVSSTRVREALAEGDTETAKKLLSPEVYEYISNLEK